MAYETWWAIHLYLYLALGLSFSHQVATGAAFAGHLAARAWWIALWAGTGAAILLFRLLVPMHRSLRHRLVVEAVEAEAPGVVSVVCRGRALDRLPVAGGQFLQWRFLTRGLWWQAHPYSLSGLPRDGRLRLTVKALGDHSAALARLRPGTRVAVEGPYGAFTKHARVGERVLLFGAGSGIAPLHPLLEDLPPEVDAEVILRASTERDVILRDELAELAALRGARVHELIGPRERTPLGAGVLRSLVPDVASRDVYVCGPSGLATAVARAARACGVSDERIHLESFAF
jgi:ferredoxin-NADP reductase